MGDKRLLSWLLRLLRLPVLLSVAFYVTLKELCEVSCRTEPVRTMVEGESDKNATIAHLRGGEDQQLLVAQKFSEYNVISTKVSRSFLSFSAL